MMKAAAVAALFLVATAACDKNKGGRRALSRTAPRPALAVEERIDDIRRPANDPSLYRYVRFSSGLRVLLRSLDSATHATVSVSVHTGHGADPANRRGLATLTELATFMQCARYPGAGEYYLTMQRANATAFSSTQRDYSQFSFNSPPSDLAPLLDAMIAHFAQPLFDQAGLESETDTLEDETLEFGSGQRVSALIAHLSRADSPASSYGRGRAVALRAPGLRSEVMRFYLTHYVADNMSAVITAPMSLEDLETLVATLFFPLRVRSSANRRPYYPIDLPRWAPELHNTYLLMQLPQNSETVFRITWQIPAAELIPQARVMSFIAYLFNNSDVRKNVEGKGVCKSLVATAETESGHAYREFNITAKFPPFPKNHPEVLSFVIFTTIIEYARYLRLQLEIAIDDPEGSEMAEWRTRWEDMQTLMKLHVSEEVIMRPLTLRDEMLHFAPADLIVGPFIPTVFSPAAILAALRVISAPRQSQVIFASTEPLENMSGNEPFFGSPYEVSTTTPEVISMVGEPIVETMRLPPRNMFIEYYTPVRIVSSNADRMQRTKSSAIVLPTRVTPADARNVLWHAQVDGANAELRVLLHLGRAPQTADEVMSHHFFTILARDILLPITNDAAVLGAQISVSAVATGIQIGVSAQHGLLQPIVEAILTVIADLAMGKIDEDIVARTRTLVQEYAKTLKENVVSGLERVLSTGGKVGLGIVDDGEPLSALFKHSIKPNTRRDTANEMKDRLSNVEFAKSTDEPKTGGRKDRVTAASTVEVGFEDMPALIPVTEQDLKDISFISPMPSIEKRLSEMQVRDTREEAVKSNSEALDEYIDAVRSELLTLVKPKGKDNDVVSRVAQGILDNLAANENELDKIPEIDENDGRADREVSPQLLTGHLKRNDTSLEAADDQGLGNIKSPSRSALKRSKRKARTPTKDDALSLLLHAQRRALASLNVIALYEGPASATDALRLHAAIVAKARTALNAQSHREGPESLAQPIALPQGIPMVLFEQMPMDLKNTASVFVPFADRYNASEMPRATAVALVAMMHLRDAFPIAMTRGASRCFGAVLDVVHAGGVPQLLFAARSKGSPIDIGISVYQFIVAHAAQLKDMNGKRFAATVAAAKDLVSNPAGAHTADEHWAAVMARANDFDMHGAVLDALNALRKPLFISTASRLLTGAKARSLAVHHWHDGTSTEALDEVYTTRTIVFEPNSVVTSERGVVATSAETLGDGHALQPAYAYPHWEMAESGKGPA